MLFGIAFIVFKYESIEETLKSTFDIILLDGTQFKNVDLRDSFQAPFS